jgi:hypothetical protein
MAAQRNNNNNTTDAILNRLEEFLKTTGDTLINLTDAIGVSRGYFSTARATKSEIGSDKITKILLLYPQLSGDWLLTGFGLMLKAAQSLKNQSEILMKEKALNDAIKGITEIQDQLQHLRKHISPKTNKTTKIKRSL